MWQDVVLLFVGGWVGHLAWARDVARRRSGKTLREVVLPHRQKTAAERAPSPTEVAT